MGVQDDFGLWEREFEEPAEPSGNSAMVVTAVVLAVACALLIALGQAPVGAAVLVIATLILILWRAGM